MSEEEKLKYITFKQFIYTINIRDCYTSRLGNEIMDNQIIRLIYDSNNKNDYIDIGWYDFYTKDEIWKTLEKTLNQSILDSIVTDFKYQDDYSCIVVYLANKNITENLTDYAN